MQSQILCQNKDSGRLLYCISRQKENLYSVGVSRLILLSSRRLHIQAVRSRQNYSWENCHIRARDQSEKLLLTRSVYLSLNDNYYTLLCGIV